MSTLADLFESSTPYLRGVEVFKDGRVAITFDIGGRSFTLPKDYIEPFLDDVLTTMPPWVEAGWLEREFKAHDGKLSKVAKQNGFSNAELRAMTHYATKELNWYIQEGHDIRRWELYTRFFASPDPAAREPVTVVGKSLGIPAANASLWAKEALTGKFFSKAMSLKNLALIQSDVFNPVYFPGEEDAGRDYALFKVKGWPHLPPGLLSDLLTSLDPLEFVSAKAEDKTLELAFEHVGQPLAFSLRLMEAAPRRLRDFGGVKALSGGVLAFIFAERVVAGTLESVREASSSNFYLFGLA